MEYQTTIKTPFSLAGPGLHTGGYIKATVLPAPVGNGIVFRRVDISPAVEIPARADIVGNTNHGTTLVVNGVTVSTIEHLMSALHGMHIDNAFVELDGPEVPILDGSARLWVEGIIKSGIQTQEAERRYYKLKQTVSWADPDSGIEMLAVPADDFMITSAIEFKSELIGNQVASIKGYDGYVDNIACCRTFVFLHEVEMLLAANLIKGGDLDNALVFVDKPLDDTEKDRLAALFGKERDTIQVHNGVLNNIEPYFANEPARHKLLDFMGDIYLVGIPVKAHFFLKCPGHRANVALAQKLRQVILQEQLTTLYDPNQPPLLDVVDIRNFMPHRYPMLLVDKVVSMTDDTIVGVKNVTVNEPYFVGHFPDKPVVPGVLVIESMAQVGGLFAMRNIENPDDYSTVLARVHDARFRLPVVPGDTVVFKIQQLSPLKMGCLRTKGEAYVGNKLVASATLTTMISKNNN
ncbi:MAG: bifunctional UDP-3-O-[3-hydroxymyristoyl] N-acetylglucosamine deacetylase/3-hydroxyacyl-ACP dehydratase [Bacteroidales bacterium]|nr:bifunctional UDP-3-O-[3-hydroxymyristoyl] N-acetylglucosamine deacetylase/3-hydroxyacyl-ACP dehydratase [Bacteroidales bacterium]